jgi:hypothetical protein
MKKPLVLATLFTAVLAFAAGVSAEGRGSVKVNFDPNVGWVILNTTASGKLNASAHLESGLPNEDFMVNVRVRYEDGSVEQFVDIATLSTNGEGKGNVQIDVDLNPPADSGTLRRVAFRLRRPGPPNILYVAVAWDLPLKLSHKLPAQQR